MIDVKSLRLGNLVHYHIFDKFDDPKESVVVNVIDAEDIKYLSENPTNESYTPIPLSEGLLVAAGFTRLNEHYMIDNQRGKTIYCSPIMDVSLEKSDDGWLVCQLGFSLHIEIKYFHQWQNFYFVWVGRELSFDLSLVGAGLGQPPAAEAIRDAALDAIKWLLEREQLEVVDGGYKMVMPKTFAVEPNNKIYTQQDLVDLGVEKMVETLKPVWK